MRSFGNEEINFAIESTMDRLCKKAGLDPIEVRLKNAVHSNYETAIGWQIQGCGLEDCIKSADELIRKDFVPYDDGHIVRSIGLACGVHWSGWRVGFNSFIWRTGYDSPQKLYADHPDSPYIKVVNGMPQWRDGFFTLPVLDNDRSSCNLILNEDGSAILHTSDPDLGQGTYTALSMIAAEVLGLTVDDFKVIGADTDSGIYGFGSYSSRVTFVAGNAVVNAATEAKETLAVVASEVLEAKPEDLEFKDHKIFVKDDPERSMQFADACFRCYSTRDAELLAFKGQYDPGSIYPDEEGKGSISEAYPFLCQAVEIELNRDTGEYKVLRVVSCHDSGTIINPSQALEQVRGAVCMGLSLGTSENLIRKDGRCVNPNFTNYHVIQMADMPDVTVKFVDQSEPNGPFGAKGLGEPGVVCIPGAVANAIENAIGVRMVNLPISPQSVLGAIAKKKAEA
jgi:CO/xanthine dehydrogenase Mo-binding subunit